MTKEEWEIVEKKLSIVNIPAFLKVDGYDVRLMLTQKNTYSNYIVPIINGQLKMEWFTEDCEERRRFFVRRTKNTYNKRKLMNDKTLTKKDKKELDAFLSERSKIFEYWELGWTNFNSMKKHLIANNESIELIK